jgi:hypothetical protein
MPQQAQVRSLEAIEAFRSHLIVYLSQARPALEEVSAEVLRTRSWIENEQRMFWEGQVKRRIKALEQAQQAVFSSRLGMLKKESAADQMELHRAKRALEEAESKLRVLKKWAREFDTRVQPLLKQTEKLHTVLSNDMVQAVTSLSQTINTLAAYEEVKPAQATLPGSSGGPASAVMGGSSEALPGPGAPKQQPA